MKSHRLSLAILVTSLGIVLAPSVAQANAGTPLMWATGFHLLIGNALIGLFEGYLLSRLFQASPLSAMVGMVIANYVSASVGAYLIHVLGPQLRALDLNTVRPAFVGLMGAAWLVTVVIELPFVACILRGKNWITRSLRASFILQTASYLLLVAGYYYPLTSKSVLTDVAIVKPHEITIPPGLLVYYVAKEDGNLHVLDVANGTDEFVQELGSSGDADWIEPQSPQRLTTRWKEDQRFPSGGYDEYVPSIEGPPLDSSPIRFLYHARATLWDEDRDSRATAIPEISATEMDLVADGDPIYAYGFGRGVIRLGKARESRWNISCSYWAFPGLVAINQETAAGKRMALETPFLTWLGRSPTLLPGDLVLFEFPNPENGPSGQICLWDITGNKVSLLARGRSPVAVLPELTDAAAKQRRLISEPQESSNSRRPPADQKVPPDVPRVEP